MGDDIHPELLLCLALGMDGLVLGVTPVAPVAMKVVLVVSMGGAAETPR